MIGYLNLLTLISHGCGMWYQRFEVVEELPALIPASSSFPARQPPSRKRKRPDESDVGDEPAQFCRVKLKCHHHRSSDERILSLLNQPGVKDCWEYKKTVMPFDLSRFHWGQHAAVRLLGELRKGPSEEISPMALAQAAYDELEWDFAFDDIRQPSISDPWSYMEADSVDTDIDL